ncbi:WD40 repeat-like protein [Laetiporus sulphureus 93-53]|uniref:WD40 repeat-like protein n=1 Tax=Laetiporus sulphureus 93-53 TaxID=1314785 RepID=A0A165G242_9APHY|nr:WD40 repeat-like protein [Laetiporus sulphureus 93-53]KZT09725.1 WD40 repeat-like protein [Laetiporus sulphureus 93-53]
MRLSDTSPASISPSLLDEASEAGPSSAVASFNGNGTLKSNGFTNGYSNGSPRTSFTDGGGGRRSDRRTSTIARVTPPGSTLYDDSYVDREEFVRLVIQSLRDVGYIESAATLEAESGYIMESPEVAEFRRCILGADWNSAEAALSNLGVEDEERLWFLISQQKYLELLEAGRTTAALSVLRNELAPLNIDPEQLHSLSSLMMCSDPDDLRQRAEWDGASGNSRRRLLMNLQHNISSSVMIPQRRFATLLDQVRIWQQSQCLYHNAPVNARTFSLYIDHVCDKSTFPRVTTAILEVHTDEVWNLEWSHSGRYLASASKDKSAIIWRVEFDKDPLKRDISPHLILRDHPYPVGCVAWSPDDSILLTAAEQHIKLWNTQTGVCIRSLSAHQDVVTALAWLPDGSGFFSGGLDRKIILWDPDGKQRDTWGQSPIRVTDLTVAPDFTRLVAVGMYGVPTPPSETGLPPPEGGNSPPVPRLETRIVVYDLTTKQLEAFIPMNEELSSVRISDDSRYALISCASSAESPCIQLWDLYTEQVVRRYTGHKQLRHVIRSRFGGIDGTFIVSGSEDAQVYVWHRETETLLEVLSGHGPGSVNSVAWNPRNEKMFASCSDDHTIRIWEALPTDALGVSSNAAESQEQELNGKGKGKSRERWDGNGVTEGYGPGTSSTASML